MKSLLMTFFVSAIWLLSAGTAVADLGAEDVKLPSQPFVGRVFATNAGNLISVRENNGVIEMHRSTDQGLTWLAWSTLGDDGNAGSQWTLWDVIHVDAAQEQVFLAIRYRLTISGATALDLVVVARADPSLDSPLWSTTTVASDSESLFSDISLGHDAENYADYYVYCAYVQADANGNDVWFARSTDKGVTFAAPYMVAGTSTSDRDFKWPALDYGFAGIVHLVWTSDLEVAGESAIMYRSGTNRGSSLGWASARYLTSIGDGNYEHHSTVAAGQADGTVLVCYERTSVPGPGEIVASDTEILHSANYGSSFAGPTVHSQFVDPALARGPAGFVVAVNDYPGDRAGLLRPASADPGGTWTFEPMLDHRSGYSCSAASNPGKGDRWCLVGSYVPDDGPFNVWHPFFDAEWFRDPGYPVLTGDLPDGSSDVCLADLTGNGKPEIIYTNNSQNLLYAFDGQLQAVAGFPVSLALGSYSSQYSLESIACGDVDGDGDVEIFVGALGMIHGFNHLGQALPGWPVSFNTGYVYKVTLGTVSRSSRLDVVAVAGTRLHLLRIDGSERARSPIIHDGITLGGHLYPAALGDVDDDGDTEMVITLSRAVLVLGPTGSLEATLWSNPGDNYVQPARLVDMDLDGDLEIAFSVGPTLYLMHHGGSTFGPTWPWSEPAGRNLTPLAFGNNLGSGQPEMFFGTSHGSGSEAAYAMTYTGTIPASWPHGIGAGFMAGVPLVDAFVGFPSGVLFLPTGSVGYGFKNFFGGMEGWPHPINVANWNSGASGDFDGDGLTEFVIPGSMLVYDTNGSATSQNTYRWPQSRFDSEGSGCANCAVDRVTAAPDEPVTLSRIAFRGGYPNPFSVQTALCYELPVGSAVRLEIYDIRGRRVREILRLEQGEGPHAMVWDRTDDRGQPVAGGIYLARLTARGPGLNEVLTRKITVLQ